MESSQQSSKPARKAKGKSPQPKKPNSKPSRKECLMDIASTTLDSIEKGSYNIGGETYDLTKKVEQMKKDTVFYAADSGLSQWSNPSSSEPDNSATVDAPKPTTITIEEISTLAGARALHEQLSSSVEDGKEIPRVGVLNFASAKNPGGGFLTGAQAQEESIARSSTAYPSFMTETAEVFYRSHRKDPKEGYYSHAMIYSPSVLLIRTDAGDWVPPVEVDLVTSCAVNAGVVRRYLRQANSDDESNLDAVMKERMARVLFLFEQQGVRNLVLGSFGTGVFRNRVELVAGVWKELLVGNNARFARSFDRVVFAILGHETYETFQRVFADNVSESGNGGEGT